MIFVLAAIAIGYYAAVIANPIPTYSYDEDETEETAEVPDTVQTPAGPGKDEEAKASAKQPAQAQPEPEEQTPPKPAKQELRYDTVSANRYLAIMAREYYGRSVYWVFIYEANADHLGDPNKIAPGTRVRIPDKIELPGATDAERTEIAQRKATEIQKRYK